MKRNRIEFTLEDDDGDEEEQGIYTRYQQKLNDWARYQAQCAYERKMGY